MYIFTVGNLLKSNRTSWLLLVPILSNTPKISLAYSSVRVHTPRLGVALSPLTTLHLLLKCWEVASWSSFSQEWSDFPPSSVYPLEVPLLESLILLVSALIWKGRLVFGTDPSITVCKSYGWKKRGVVTLYTSKMVVVSFGTYINVNAFHCQ